MNTCAVTAEAVRQARQTIRRIKRERPQARIVVTGCAAQTEPATFAGMAEVDRVIGNEEKLDPRMWAADDRRIAVGDIMAVKRHAAHAIDSIEGHTRAFLQVQNGCDHRCTFCIIPFGRGNARSLPMDEAWRRRAGSPRAAIANWCSPASISPATARSLPARRGSARWSSAF